MRRRGAPAKFGLVFDCLDNAAGHDLGASRFDQAAISELSNAGPQ